MPDDVNPAPAAEFWDDFYRASHRIRSGDPNAALVREAAELPPGRALDLGCGEGADAIWLAQQGWEVRAVDVSTVALDRTASHAIQSDVSHRLKVGVYDVMIDEPPIHTAAYDLVTAHFLHVPREDFDDVYRRIATAVAPGGRLLVVAHHPDDVESGARRPHGPGLLFPPEQVLEALDAGDDGEWEVEVADAPVREQQTEEGPIRVRDTVVRLRLR